MSRAADETERTRGGCCAGSRASRSSLEAPQTPRSDELIAHLREAEAALRPLGARQSRCRGSARNADGRRPRRTSTTRATSARSTRASPSTRSRVDGDRAVGHRRRSRRLRGPAGHRARRLPGRVLRLVIQHHNCDVGVAGKTTSLAVRVPAADPARSRDCTFEIDAHGRRTAGSTSTARLLRRRRACCARRRWRPSPATGRSCRAVSPRRSGAMTATTIDAGDGLPLTVPALLRGAGRRARRRVRSLVCDDDVLTLRRRRRTIGRARPGPARRRARARARTSGCSTRTAPTSSSPGWPRPASAR